MPSRPKIFYAHGQRSTAQVKVDSEANRKSARERGYGPRWDRASAGFKRAHPLCLGCEAIGRYVATAVTDHVEPHKGDMAKFWNAVMWQPACKWHHDVVKQQLEQRFARNEVAVDDLRLDSAVAVRLTLELIDMGQGGYQNFSPDVPGPAD
jgi:5-methylcytosine-specific restriction endonuclease McrA